MFKSINLIIFLPILINLLMYLLLMNMSKNIMISPMMLMLILIMLTMLISLKMNFIFYSWISFILFLMMIGGLMVIFLYITSLSNNEFFSINLKFMYLNLIKITPFILIYLMINLMNIELNLFNMINLDSYMINMNYNQSLYNSLYKNNNNNSTYFIMIYLYYSMICIMNICYKFKAPLRQLMFYV